MFISRRLGKAVAVLSVVVLAVTGISVTTAQAAPTRPDGSCDVYQAAGLPCWAAHSTTRALKASYDGPLYQVQRVSDGALKDIPVVQPFGDDPGGYADAAVQDAFCAGSFCEIVRVYDQSGLANDIYRGPRGGADSGPQMGGANNVPPADWAPVSVNGHKVYGMFTSQVSGLRNNDTTAPVVDDMPESEYWLLNGLQAGSGCCYGYGNGETDSRDDGDGTMEAMAFGINRGWHYGTGPGPWLYTDQENNLIGCVGSGTWLGQTGYGTRFCETLPPVTWRWAVGFGTFGSKTTETPDGYWANRGANLQTGELTTYWEGKRLSSNYNPMRKQGAIYFGTGGDNSVGSTGTMYEGAMVRGVSTEAIDKLVLANIQAAKYDEYRLKFAPAGAAKDNETGTAGNNLMTFGPGVAQDAVMTWTNTTGATASVTLSADVPAGYTISPSSQAFASVAAGATVSTTFTITGGTVESNDDIVGKATFTVAGAAAVTETAIMRARNTAAIKINEFSISTTGNTTNSFIELYNSGTTAVNISNWDLTYRPSYQAVHTSVKVPAGTTLAAGEFYTFGLSTSGLVTPAAAGSSTIHVRSITGISAGQTITVGSGANAETATVQTVGSVAATQAANTVIFMQLPPDCPVANCPSNSVNTKFPAGTNNLPVTVTTGFTVGQKVQVGYGDTLEVLEVASVGVAGAQIWLSPSGNGTGAFTTAPLAVAGSTNLKVSSVTAIRAGMTLRLDIADKKEYVTVVSVGTAGMTGTGVTIADPLKYTHSNNMSLAVPGTGVTFTTATTFDHWSSEPIRPLGTGITLTAPLANNHPIYDAVQRDGATTAGYQGTPNQWYGGPAFQTAGNASSNAGSIVLRTAAGNIADSLNYGKVADPYAAEGYQGDVVTANAPTGCKMPGPPNNYSAVRRVDGYDKDSNCKDFVMTTTRTPGAAFSYAAPTTPMVSIQFAKDTNQWIMVKDRVAGWYPIENEQDKLNASFYVMPALTGAAGCISLMSAAHPGMYLWQGMHRYYLVQWEGTTFNTTDGYFCPVKAVGNTSPTVSITDGPSNDIIFRSTSSLATGYPSYLRALYKIYGENGLYLAAPGVINLPNAGDTPTNFNEDILWNVVEALGLNKVDLQADVDSVGDLVESHYTAASWAGVQALLPGAQAILDQFGGPSQAVIDTATTELETAIAALVPGSSLALAASPAAGQVAPGDVTLTATLANEVAVSSLAGKAITFTANGTVLATVATDATGAASYTVVGPTAGVYTYEASFAGDSSVYAASDKIVSYVVAQSPKAVLEALVETAEAVAANGDQYTAESLANLENAIAVAKAVLANPNPTNTEIAAAEWALMLAISNMEAKTPDVDKSVLASAINSASKLSNKTGTYTAASWTVFSAALLAAQDILANPNATQDEVDQAVMQLTAAMAGLVPASQGPPVEVHTGGSVQA